jgi:hypothetical protein
VSDLRPQIGARAPEWCGCPTCAQASQLKFHDLHLDSFRMLQALEWQPSALQKRVPKPPPTSRQASDGAEAVAGAAGAGAAGAGAAGAVGAVGAAAAAGAGAAGAGAPGAGAPGAGPVGAGAAERANPHKYVLHRATAAQLTLVLATAMVELPPRGALPLRTQLQPSIPRPQPPTPTRPQPQP